MRMRDTRQGLSARRSPVTGAAPLTAFSGGGSNPGALGAIASARGARRRRAAGRRAPRLHPDRGRLRRGHRLVATRRPRRLRAAVSRTASRQQSRICASTGSSRRTSRAAAARRSRSRRWSRRWSASTARSRAGLRHRPFRRRRDGGGDAGDLSRGVRRRRDHRRTAVWLCKRGSAGAGADGGPRGCGGQRRRRGGTPSSGLSPVAVRVSIWTARPTTPWSSAIWTIWPRSGAASMAWRPPT